MSQFGILTFIMGENRITIAIRDSWKEKYMKKLAFLFIALVLALGLALPVATPVLADNTVFKFPTSYATGTTGEPPGDPENALVDDVPTGTGGYPDIGTCVLFKQGMGLSELYYDFGFGIPPEATIDGIEVVVSGYSGGGEGSNEPLTFGIRLSGDTGLSWTGYQETSPRLVLQDAEYTLGGLADLWGKAWNAGSFSDGNFRLEVVTPHFGHGDFVALDSVRVKVYYTPAAYVFGGFLPPIKADGSGISKLGSTVPVKFQLTDANGNFVTNAIATISLQKYNGNTPVGNPIDGVSTSAATTGNLFRYNPASNQYIFNLATKGLSVGKWQIKVTLNDGACFTVFISLK